MKRILDKTGVDSSETKKNYFDIIRSTPPHLKKKMKMSEFHSMIEQLRNQHEKKS
ncbi:hypothetical protein SAMN05660236_5827 [Ohtaekwangia koreensis]|uniref:Uncharacterized protein n=1 Tax=Ohtaekwangia koreensis TaxID=688867 RepID=A0A1T5MMW7_9BACT|nr:hypothetical protein SAMN05660236_5827 [Ohtaekwangia koreensis]